jgi:hypothetical protein
VKDCDLISSFESDGRRKCGSEQREAIVAIESPTAQSKALSLSRMAHKLNRFGAIRHLIAGRVSRGFPQAKFANRAILASDRSEVPFSSKMSAACSCLHLQELIQEHCRRDETSSSCFSFCHLHQL